MTATLHIDPGRGKKGAVGWAVFENRDLLTCGVVRGEAHESECAIAVRAALSIAERLAATGNASGSMSSRLSKIVCEKMQVYTGLQAKGNQEALIELSHISSICAGVLVGCGAADSEANTIEYVLPAEWKGQVPKPIMLERIRSELRKRAWELDLAERLLGQDVGKAKKMVHNGYDAIGIGLTHVRRLGR